MFYDYFSLAFSNLKKRGLRSWLTMLGIFIGIAALVSLISLGTSLQNAIIGQFGALSVDTLTIQNKGAGFGPPGSTVVEKLNSDDLEIIQNVRGVELVIPRILRVVEIKYNDISNFIYAIDLPSDREGIEFVYENLNLEIESGSLIEQGDSGVVLVGNDAAEGRQFEKEIQIRRNIEIEGEVFKVKGILEKTSNFQINGVYLIPREDFEDILNIEDEYDFIIAKVENPDQIERVAEQIENRLRDNRNEDIGEESFSVETPLQSLESVQTILNIINLIIAGIAGISLFVGGVGISNTMYTSVLERTREIGVMKAIGAKNKDIFWLFLIEAGLLGLAGGIIGAAMGLGAAKAVSYIANNALGQVLFQIEISYPLLFGAIGFSFLVGIISGTIPAIQGSKLNVVDALRS
ncbi:ABC transporter permease [Candidatus Pacearchaeota archaeon]|nr:ABC transporter permease [Candidatus Pacearchaeota archaeon]